MNAIDRLGQFLRDLEARVIADAQARQKASYDKGVKRNREYINRWGGTPEDAQAVANAIRDMTDGGDRLPDNLKLDGDEAVARLQDRRRRGSYARYMDRGMLGGERAASEVINELIAENEMARRVGLPALVGAGTVLGLTAAGKGLVGLTNYVTGNNEPRLDDVAALVGQGLTAEQAITLLKIHG